MSVAVEIHFVVSDAVVIACTNSILVLGRSSISRENDESQSRCFCIIEDDTQENVSMMKCISAKYPGFKPGPLG